jgi:hypothetical protein
MFRPAAPSGASEPPEEAAAFNAALRQPAKERADAKKEALDACSAEHLELLHCYKRGSLTLCAESRAAFWACYKKRRVRGGIVRECGWRDAVALGCVLTQRCSVRVSLARRGRALARRGCALRCAARQRARNAGATLAHCATLTLALSHADMRVSRSRSGL